MFSNINDQKTVAKSAIGSQEIIRRISAKAFGHFVEDSVESDHVTPHTEDVLSTLKSNIAELEDVSARLRFMMREVSYLLRRY